MIFRNDDDDDGSFCFFFLLISWNHEIKKEKTVNKNEMNEGKERQCTEREGT